ncbi:hypothetical protein ACF09Y_24695 [Streptomyces massasporeus]|uniref:hypothetical protein n=1 Tax=Streptomyces massasporeus TaxID=67324 RepID=UPI0036FADAA6
MDGLMDTEGTVIVDSFALYQIATGHSPKAEAVREALLQGLMAVSVSAMAVATACGMRSCWDEYCSTRHPGNSSTLIRNLCVRPDVDMVPPSLEASMAAGRLYASSASSRVEGAEVLSSCHSALVAQERGHPLLTTARAAYCYSADAVQQLGIRMLTL